MPETDLDLLIAAARAAGEIARPFWRADPRKWDKPGDAGPVSEADLAVNVHLHDRLRAARPDYGWLSEESEDDPERLAREYCFIVDPIDGTRAFLAGQSAWSHSLAVTRNGHVSAAVVYLPIPDKLYVAAAGQGATLNGQPIHVSQAADPEVASILTSKAVLAPENWRGLPPANRHFRPSLAYRLSLVAEGRFDAMLTLRPTWEWDIAAGCLIVAEAGGRAATRSGAAPVFNTPGAQTDGLLATSPTLYQPLLDRLA